MIPQGWKESRLGDIFESRREKGRPNLPTLSVTINGGLLDRSALNRKMDTTLEPHEHLIVEVGDIAYNMMSMWQGACGLVHLNGIVSPAYVVLKPTKYIDSHFASYLFKMPRMIHLFWAYSHGLTDDRRRLYFDDFSVIKIFLPPLAEQRRIAEILSTWDRAIEITEKLIAKTEAMKNGLMQQLFPREGENMPRLRFPEFRIAGEWMVTSLGKMGKIISGLTYAPSDVRDNGLLVLRSSNIRNGSIALEDCVYVTPDIKGANLSRKNDILICVRNGSKTLIGKTALIPENMPLCTHGAFMTAFRARNPKFVYQLFQTVAYQKQVQADLGAGINSINTGQLNKYNFSVPLQSEQQKISDYFSTLDVTISTISRKLEMLKTQKTALIQQLMTGKRRVTASRKEEVKYACVHDV